ncbi:hypothetical protein B0H14DRAFT_2313397, partial [Mycena olivaceomarginata]
PILAWIPLQDEYLAELIRLEGCGDVCITHCPTCPEKTPPKTPRYRCKNCSVPDLFCKECCVKAHARHPLDHIEVCDPLFFLFFCKLTHITLKYLGLRVQLGHRIGEVCTAPLPAHAKFTVVHNNSIHDVAVDYCGCKDETVVGSCRQQLLQRSWYPAT